MDLNRQAEAMMRLLAADFSEETDLFWNTSVGKDSFLHSAWLWDGVLLWANEIRMTELSYTGNLYGRKDYLLLNICHAGRCEVELSSGRYVYMSPGTLNVSCSPPGSSYHYTGGVYQGIELCFDIQKMGKQIPAALSDYGFDASALQRFVSKENPCRLTSFL